MATHRAKTASRPAASCRISGVRSGWKAACLSCDAPSCSAGRCRIGYLPVARGFNNMSGMGSMDRHTIANMGSRVEQCRRLAKSTTDQRAAKVLLQIAEDGEADIARILTGRRPSGAK